MKIHRVVLVGAQGQGKTTFFNSITNQNQETTYAGSSCTRQIVQSQTVYGQGFEVIDTPGFDSSENKLLHISGILAALTFGKVNRILIVTKYERNEPIIKNLELVFRPIHRYRSIVTVIFTHWDFCVKGQEEKETTRIKELIEKRFKIVSFLFFTKTKDPEITCKQIEAILKSEAEEENIKLLESEIFKYFDILELDSDNEDMMVNHKTMILREFSKISKAYINFIKSLSKENPYFLSILHEITLLIKEEANNKVEEFEKKYGEEILKMVDIQNNNIQYLHYIYLKKEIRKDIESVIDLASSKMSDSKIHIFKYLKKCPYCGQIWLKVIGCDGQTTCGNAVNSKTDGFLHVQPQSRIKIIRNQNNEINYQINENKTVVENNEFLEQIFKICFGDKFSENRIKYLELFEKIIISQYGENYNELLIDQIIKGELTIPDLQSQISQIIAWKFQNFQFQQGNSFYEIEQFEANQIQSETTSSNSLEQPNSQKDLLYSLYLQLQSQTHEHQPQHIRPNMQQGFNFPQFIMPPFQQMEAQIFNFQANNFQKKQNKAAGCGKQIVWSQLPKMTSDEINQLFSSELLEYFADQDKIEKEEVDWLNKSYKEIVNESILQAQNNILILKKNQIENKELIEKNQTQ